MTRSKYISIPNPCHENWESMKPNEQGRHCFSCEKTVIDFTSMADYEIIDYFKRNKNGCGRFTSTQLQKSYDLSHSIQRLPLYKALVFSIINFFGIQSFSQNTKTSDGTEIVSILPQDTFLGDTVVNQIIIEDSAHIDTNVIVKEIDSSLIDSGTNEVIEIPKELIMVCRGFGISTRPFVYDAYDPIFPEKPILILPSPLDTFKENTNKDEVIFTENPIVEKKENKKSPQRKELFKWMGILSVNRFLKKKQKI